jgi:hypothetical protein
MATAEGRPPGAAAGPDPAVPLLSAGKVAGPPEPIPADWSSAVLPGACRAAHAAKEAENLRTPATDAKHVLRPGADFAAASRSWADVEWHVERHARARDRRARARIGPRAEGGWSAG